MRVAKTKALISFAVYCEADMHLCFRICRLLVFPFGGSYNTACLACPCFPSLLGGGGFGPGAQNNTILYAGGPGHAGNQSLAPLSSPMPGTSN